MPTGLHLFAEICRVTRGRNLVISSAAKALYELRGPFNICALAIACGLQPAEAKVRLSLGIGERCMNQVCGGDGNS